MAQTNGEIPTKIPAPFRKAKNYFLRYAYRNRLLDGLPLSLTLGGVLYGLTDRYFLGTTGTYPYVRLLIPLASMLLVPVIAVWRMSNEIRGEITLRWSRRAPLERVLFFLLFDMRCLVAAVGDLDALLHGVKAQRPEHFPAEPIRKAVRKVRTTLLDVERLANVVADSLEAPSGTFLLRDLFRLRRNRLLKKIGDYRSATRQYLNSVGHVRDSMDRATVSSHVRFSTLNAVRASIVHQVAEIVRATDPAIARAALLVTTQIGTNNMMRTLAWALSELEGDDEGRKSAARLLEAVEATRTGGRLIRDLLDLTVDETHAPERWDKHDEGREAATDGVATNFRKVFDAKFGSEGNRVAVATIGYSTTVTKCLEAVQHAIGPVFILQCDQQTTEADDTMLAELEDMEIEAEIIDVKASRGDRLHEVKVVLLGFEAVSLKGKLAHRQGLEAVLQPIREFIVLDEERENAAMVCAVGESWKVRDFDDQQEGRRRGGDRVPVKVPARLIYTPGAAFRIVTDCHGPDPEKAYHEADREPDQEPDQEHDFNLRCCLRTWQEKFGSRHTPVSGERG